MNERYFILVGDLIYYLLRLLEYIYNSYLYMMIHLYHLLSFVIYIVIQFDIFLCDCVIKYELFLEKT